MKITTRQVFVPISTLLLLFIHTIVFAIVDSTQTEVNVLLFEKAQNIRHQDPDSSINILERCITGFMENQDTTNAIKAFIELAKVHGHRANYKESYDKLWKALILADEAKMEKVKANVYIDIGRYYSFYKRKEKALHYFGLSLDINKRLVEKGLLEKADLVSNYYFICATFRELNEPVKGQIYLDSCFLYHSPGVSKINIASLQFEQAFLLKEEKRYKEAMEIFQEIIPWFEENDPAYQVLIYTYMGDTYKGLHNFSESEIFYKKAIRTSEKYNSHIDFTPLVHEKLSDLFYSRGDYLQAYKSLKRVKELDEIFFDSRSENNRPLLEIQDAFRKENENRKKLEQEKRLAQLEHEEKVLFLQKTILIVSMAFLVLIGIIYFNYVRSKHRAEKLLIRKKQELEIQKANEMVELKNKELATSALKLIEKDEFLYELKNKLSNGTKDINVRELKTIVRSVSKSNAQNWKEFEARFVSVNKSFYYQLRDKFPNLTQGDQKLCALIKLNFSSKDMSRLMGISVESVHTTRYRLRKKLKLTRDKNLTEFIANL